MRGGTAGPADDGPADIPWALRAGGPRDAHDAAVLHAQLISEGFLSSLGVAFLTRLYGRIVRSDGSFLLIAEAEGTAIGFIAGSVGLRALYRSFIWRDGVAVVLRTPFRLVTALPRVVETLRHGGAETDMEGAELLAVAVRPAWRGHQIGGQLVEGFSGELERRGVGFAHVVVGADNTTAIAMYRRAGFVPARTFEMHRGTRSLLMQRTVPNRSLPSASPGS